MSSDEDRVSAKEMGAIALIGVPPFAYAFYEHATYSGLTRWLAETEIRVFGVSHPTAITLLVATVVGLVWGTPLAYAILRRNAKSDAPSRRASGAFDWSNLVVIAPIVALSVHGAVLWISALRMGSLVDVDVAELERAQSPPGRYVRLLGQMVVDQAVTIENSKPLDSEVARKVSTFDYVPIVSDRWLPGKPVAAFIEVPSSLRWRLDSAENPTGTLKITGLGPTATFFEEKGIAVSKPSWVLEWGNTPDKEANAGKLFVAGGPATGLLAWAIAAWRRRHKRVA